MPYAIQLGESIEEAIGRIILEQIERATARVDDPGTSLQDSVHDVRRRCKKIRAALRLVRDPLSTYSEENRFFRDTARLLAPARDGDVQIQTFDTLVEHHGEAIEPLPRQRFRAALVDRRDCALAELRQAGALEQARQRLLSAKERVADWSLGGIGFEALGSGLGRTYRRCRRRLKETSRADSDPLFHELRKRSKYHRHQTDILRRVWPGVFDAREQACHELTDLLGDDHDAVVLRESVEQNEPLLVQPAADVVVGLCMRRTLELRSRSRQLARRLFADKTKHFVRRVEACWEVFQNG